MASIRVLYVDDEPSLLDIVKIYLERSGEIEVGACSSVEEAERTLLAGPYDAIISDYQMPGTTGIDFLKRLRARNDRIPFGLFTGRGREEVAIEALNNGADFYLQKGGNPTVQFAELEHYIRQGVQRHRAEKAKIESEEHFRSLVDNSFEGIGVHIDKVLVETNNAFCEITGYTREELIGKSITELFTPDTFEVMRERLRLPASKPYDAGLVRKDGRIVKVKTRGKDINWNGRVARLGTILDLTGREDMEELREKEKILRVLVEASTDIVWEIDPQGVFTYTSPRITDVLGYTPEETVGGSIFSLTPMESMEEARNALLALLNEPTKANRFEVDARHKDGKLVRIDVTSSPFYDSEGRLKGFRGLARDVTEHREVENALQRSERRFESLFDESPLGIILFDKDGILIDINPAGMAMFGVVDKTPVVGSSIFDDPHLTEENRSSLLEGKVVRGKLRYVPPAVDRALGSGLKGKGLWLDITVIPLFEDLTSLSGYEMQVRDVSESMITREREEERNALLSAILESSPDVIVFALDREYRYLAYNTRHAETIRRIWGRDVAVGKGMLDLVGAEEDRRRAKENYDRALSGESFTVTEEYGDVALERLTWQDYYSPIVSAGEITGLTVYCLNVTERERAKHEMQDANNKLRIITSVTRHDMLNKLTALHAYLDMEGRRTSDQRLLASLDKMGQIADTLVSQINFTKEYQDIGLLKPEWQSVKNACILAREQLDPGRVDTRVETDGLEILADPMLKKVIYNLMDNSIKHGQKVTMISIGHEQNGQGVLITYRDDGVGIDAQLKDRLFTEGVGKNHGLGLFLAKEILKITGITIRENGEPGRGARFELFVPEGKYRFR